MRKLFASLVCLALASCAGGAGLDLQNSAQYQQEFLALGAQATQVHAHITADLTRGKTKEQIAADAGFAALNATLQFLATLPAAASRPAR